MTFALLLFIGIHCNALAQASWHTQFAFIMRDENNKAIDPDGFKDSYKLIDVFGNTVSNDKVSQYLRFDKKTNYFILDITTIGPRFSFAIVHKDELMVIYLPFNHDHIYYAVDLKFRKGNYLFSFDTTGKKKIYLNSNMPQYIIKKINWKKQHKKLEKSSYLQDETYNEYKNN